MNTALSKGIYTTKQMKRIVGPQNAFDCQNKGLRFSINNGIWHVICLPKVAIHIDNGCKYHKPEVQGAIIRTIP